MYGISNGNQPMRSRNEIPHDKISYYPDLLRKAGYHTSNPGKTDYNIGGRDDYDAWDVGKGKGTTYGWKKRQADQPFFAVVNIGESHESRAHGDNEDIRNDPAKMKLFSYHPDLPEIRKTYAKYADAVENMDEKVGQCLAELEKDGLTDNTIVIYNSDHGGVLARSKRFCYSSGIHCPLVVRIPEKLKHLYPANEPGAVIDRLVSFVDMPRTWLSLAGAEIPDTFQGTVFLGEGIEEEPAYHLAFRERADERLDCVRVIRDKRYAYHKNYMPYAPAGQHLAYLWKAEATPAWEQHHREGKTDEITGRFFRPRVSEEFYDTVEDFDNVHNLISEKQYQQKIAEMRKAMRKMQLDLYDSGLLPETMRDRRAAANNMTLYEMVRNPKLYPLATYLDAADMALERDADNLTTLVNSMSHEDECIRYWAVVGLFLLENNAAAAVDTLEKALQDDSFEVRMMAAWAMVRLGHENKGLNVLNRDQPLDSPEYDLKENIQRWMGKDALR
jgi:N-sulfoglucosamine sulfohydrolase